MPPLIQTETDIHPDKGHVPDIPGEPKCPAQFRVHGIRGCIEGIRGGEQHNHGGMDGQEMSFPEQVKDTPLFGAEEEQEEGPPAFVAVVVVIAGEEKEAEEAANRLARGEARV